MKLHQIKIAEKNKNDVIEKWHIEKIPQRNIEWINLLNDHLENAGYYTVYGFSKDSDTIFLSVYQNDEKMQSIKFSKYGGYWDLTWDWEDRISDEWEFVMMDDDLNWLSILESIKISLIKGEKNEKNI